MLSGYGVYVRLTRRPSEHVRLAFGRNDAAWTDPIFRESMTVDSTLY